VFLLRLTAARGDADAAVPVIAGCFELVMVYLFWDAVLEAQQTHRSLAREPLLWLGLGLALAPPIYANLGWLVGPFGK
jgi:hypothetical protein